jgi:hypothetical protein
MNKFYYADITTRRYAQTHVKISLGRYQSGTIIHQMGAVAAFLHVLRE